MPHKIFREVPKGLPPGPGTDAHEIDRDLPKTMEEPSISRTPRLHTGIGHDRSDRHDSRDAVGHVAVRRAERSSPSTSLKLGDALDFLYSEPGLKIVDGLLRAMRRSGTVLDERGPDGFLDSVEVSSDPFHQALADTIYVGAMQPDEVRLALPQIVLTVFADHAGPEGCVNSVELGREFGPSAEALASAIARGRAQRDWQPSPPRPKLENLYLIDEVQMLVARSRAATAPSRLRHSPPSAARWAGTGRLRAGRWSVCSTWSTTPTRSSMHWPRTASPPRARS